MQFPILFTDANFCCGLNQPERAENISGWLPGRAQNRGAFQFSKFTKKSIRLKYQINTTL